MIESLHMQHCSLRGYHSRRPFIPHTGSKPSPSIPSSSYSQTFTPKLKPSVENKDQNPVSQPICNYCKRTGHIISECLKLKGKKEKPKPKEGPKPTGLTFLRLKPQSCVKEKFLLRPKHLRLILLWRFMTHSYQMVLCH